MSNYQVPAFLADLLHARSPSGYEGEAQAVFDRYVKPAADTYANDALGNRIATLNPKGDPVLMLAGHMDELGLIITYVNKDGFIYFDTIGGHDRTVISGRRVIIQTATGPVNVWIGSKLNVAIAACSEVGVIWLALASSVSKVTISPGWIVRRGGRSLLQKACGCLSSSL